MPRYSDYHRTIVGYHGTKRPIALEIIQGLRPFDWSRNETDWLGHGIYFWEYAPQQAWLWAEKRRRENHWSDETAVVASMIRLGRCFDLLDPENTKALRRSFEGCKETILEAGKPLPANVRSDKRLNCAAFEFAYANFRKKGQDVDTCRAVFLPTEKDRLWQGSGINPRAHIQVVVRNPDCILGTWLVKPIGERKDGDE